MRYRYILIIILFLLNPQFATKTHSEDTLNKNDIVTKSPKSIDFLSNKKYQNLEIEIFYTKYCAPNPDAIAFLCSKIKYYCHKNIHLINTEIAPITSTDQTKLFNLLPMIYGLWHASQLTAFVNTYKTTQTHDATLVLYIIYAPGFLLATPTVVGEAFAEDKFVIFRQRIRDQWEKNVLLHEMGHILGLVNSKKENHDKCHYWHCKNSKCVMYWCCEGEEIPDDFDETCQKHLREQILEKKYY